MSEAQKNIKISEEKIKYLFFNSFRDKYKLLSLEVYPNYVDKNSDTFFYDIEIELDILEEIDPDIDYLFENVEKVLKEVLEFCKKYTINLDGKLEFSLPYEFSRPVFFGIEYLYGKKLEIKTLIRASVL
jgi:hypothetical protein